LSAHVLSHLGRPVLSSIFVNYRRNDSEGEAGRLFDDLTLNFSQATVFMDVEAIEAGRDFRKAIDESVANCSMLLAIIGQEWLDAKDAEGRRRLDDPNDFVRIELASALRRDIPVVPVLVRAAKMPRADQLPDDLKELAYRNALELTHARWKSDVQVLIKALRRNLGMPSPDAPSANEAVADNESSGSAVEPSAGQASASLGEGQKRDATATIEPQMIERVARELAAYIGPIAEVVVKRAARRCASAEDLYITVAREIESEADRARFLKLSRS
jgi:hypothetical protein